jgi:hypothetical protein
MNVERKTETLPLATIECSYCRSKIGLAGTEPPPFAVCSAKMCHARYVREVGKITLAAGTAAGVEKTEVKQERKEGAAKESDTAVGGHFEKDIPVGNMLVKVYRNQMKSGEVAFKCRLYRRLPEHYIKSLSDTIPQNDLNDAMRALYRAQRFIRRRRRQLGLCRGVLSWLP